MLAVKEDQKSCLKHFSRRDFADGAGDGIDSAVFLATLYSKLNTGYCTWNSLPIVCVTDNHTLLDAIKSTKSVTEKRLLLEVSSENVAVISSSSS